MAISPLEKKYGKNDLKHLMMCPQCADAIPVFVRRITTEDRFGVTQKEELHCLKCKKLGHKDGTFIKACHS